MLHSLSNLSKHTAELRPQRSDQLRPPQKAIARGPSDLDVTRLTYPVQLLAGIIRTVLGLGDHTRLHPNEFHLVDGALRCVSAEYSADALPGLVDEVFALALRDHAQAKADGRTFRERPTLAYVFGGPDDAHHLPHRFFLDRVCQLRERKAEAEKHQQSHDHAWFARVMFGGTEPAKPLPLQSTEAQRRPSRVASPSRPRLRSTPPASWRLSEAEIEASLAQVEASWEQPYGERVGGAR